MDAAVRAVERAGGRVRRLRFDPWMADLVDAHAAIQGYEASQALGYEYDCHRAGLSALLRDFLEHAAGVSTEVYRQALGRAQVARVSLLPRLFQDIDVILTPSAPDEAPVGLASTGDPAFNRNWTLLGTPCVGIPGLRGKDHGHIGVQVIGLPGDDARTLAAAAFVEAAIRRV
jgi:Asp-tRNA(Asn)/Glu-tRNA(Gln) amidotransferase A subunit family amidase